MPYIMHELRQAVLDDGPTCAGELNYFISAAIHKYLDNRITYYQINEVIGVLECCKLELYRQLAAPYEDIKKDENGSVSNLDG